MYSKVAGQNLLQLRNAAEQHGYGILMGTDCRLTDSISCIRKYWMGQLWFSTSIHVSSRRQLPLGSWHCGESTNPCPNHSSFGLKQSILCIQVSTQDCSLLPSVGRSFLSEGLVMEFLPALSIQAIGGLHCTRDMWIDEVYVKHWEDIILGTGCKGTRKCRYFYDHLDIIRWLSSRHVCIRFKIGWKSFFSCLASSLMVGL